MSRPTPSADEVEDIVLSARFGELDELKEFVEKYGEAALGEARDDRGNTVLHMCCGNGHLDVLNYLLPLVPKSLLKQTNEAGSPPIHFAVSNNHVSCVKALVELPEEQGGGVDLLHQKTAAGRDAFDESMFAGEGKEEVSGWIEGYLYRVEGDGQGAEEEGPTSGSGSGSAQNKDGEEEVQVIEGDEMVREEAERVDELAEQTEGVQIKE